MHKFVLALLRIFSILQNLIDVFQKENNTIVQINLISHKENFVFSDLNSQYQSILLDCLIMSSRIIEVDKSSPRIFITNPALALSLHSLVFVF